VRDYCPKVLERVATGNRGSRRSLRCCSHRLQYLPFHGCMQGKSYPDWSFTASGTWIKLRLCRSESGDRLAGECWHNMRLASSSRMTTKSPGLLLSNLQLSFNRHNYLKVFCGREEGVGKPAEGVPRYEAPDCSC
jgi:hypothetical protein